MNNGKHQYEQRSEIRRNAYIIHRYTCTTPSYKYWSLWHFIVIVCTIMVMMLHPDTIMTIATLSPASSSISDVSSHSPSTATTNHNTHIPAAATIVASSSGSDATNHGAIHSLDPIQRNDDRSLLIFTTLDGAIVALDATNGMIRWQLDTGGALINIGSSRMSSRPRHPTTDDNDTDNEDDDDDGVSVFPGVYGELFTHVKGKGLHRLAYNAWQLVDRSPLPIGDSILFFGNKSSSHFGLDPWSGAVHQSPAHESGDTSNDAIPPSSSSSRVYLALVRTNFGIRATRVDVPDANNGWDLSISRIQLYLHTGSRKNNRGNTNSDDHVYDRVPLIRVSGNGSITAHDGHHGRVMWHYKLPCQPVSLHGLVISSSDATPLFGELPLSFDMSSDVLRHTHMDHTNGMQYLLQFNPLSPGSEHWYGTVLALANQYDGNDDSHTDATSTAITKSSLSSAGSSRSSTVLLRPPHHMHMKASSNGHNGHGWLHDDALIGHDTHTNLLMGPDAAAPLLPLQRAARSTSVIDNGVTSTTGALVTTNGNGDSENDSDSKCVSGAPNFPMCLGGLYDNDGGSSDIMITPSRASTPTIIPSVAAPPLLLTTADSVVSQSPLPSPTSSPSAPIAPVPDISVVPVTRARHGYSTRVAEPDDADIADHPASHHHTPTVPTPTTTPTGGPSSTSSPSSQSVGGVHVPVPPPTLISGPIPYSPSSPAWYQDQHNHQYVLHLPDWLAQYLIIGVLVLVFAFAFVTFKMLQARKRLRESVANTPKVSPQLHSSANILPSDLALPSAAMLAHVDRTPILTAAGMVTQPSPMMNGMMGHMAGTAPSPLPSPYLTASHAPSPHVPSPLLIPASSPNATIIAGSTSANGSPTLPPLPPSQLSQQHSQPLSQSAILQSPYRGPLPNPSSSIMGNNAGIPGLTLSGDGSYNAGGVDPLLGTLLPAPLTLQPSPPLALFSTPLPSPPSLLRVHTSPNLAKYSQSAHPITSSNRFGRVPRIDRAPSHDVQAGQWMNHSGSGGSHNGSGSGSGSGSDGNHPPPTNQNRRTQHRGRPRAGTVDSISPVGSDDSRVSPLDGTTPRHYRGIGSDELSPINNSNSSSAMPSPHPSNGPTSPTLTRARSRPISTTRGSHHATMPHGVLQRALSDSPPSSWMSSDSPMPSSSSASGCSNSRNSHMTSSIGSGAGSTCESSLLSLSSSSSPAPTPMNTDASSNPPSWFQGTLPSSLPSSSPLSSSASTPTPMPAPLITSPTTPTVPGLLSRALSQRVPTPTDKTSTATATANSNTSNHVNNATMPASSFAAAVGGVGTTGMPRASPAHKKHASMGGALTGTVESHNNTNNLYESLIPLSPSLPLSLPPLITVASSPTAATAAAAAANGTSAIAAFAAMMASPRHRLATNAAIVTPTATAIAAAAVPVHPYGRLPMAMEPWTAQLPSPNLGYRDLYHIGAAAGFGAAKSRFRDIPPPRHNHETKLTAHGAAANGINGNGKDQLGTPLATVTLGTSPLDQFSRMISKDRFSKDFETTGDRAIGQGGFGTVISARNRLDDREYAIKKIKLWQHQTEVNAVVLREVKSLAKLDHPNIVRYFQSWVEEIEEGDEDDESDGEGDEDEEDGSINSSFNSSIASPLPSTSATGPASPFPPQPNAYYNAQAAKRKQSLVAAAAKEAAAKAAEEEERKAKAAAALSNKRGSVIAANGRASLPVAPSKTVATPAKASAAAKVAAKSTATPSKKPATTPNGKASVATTSAKKAATPVHDDTDTDEDDAAYEDTDLSDADDIKSPTSSASSAKKAAAANKTPAKAIPAKTVAAKKSTPASVPAKKKSAAQQVKSDDDEEDDEEEDDQDDEDDDNDDDESSKKGSKKSLSSVNTSIDDDDDDNASVSSKTSTLSPRAGSVADSDDDSRPTSPVAATRTLSGAAVATSSAAVAGRPRAKSAAVPSTKPLDTKTRTNTALNAALDRHKRSDSLDSLSSLSSTEVPSPSGMTGAAGGLMSPVASAAAHHHTLHTTPNVGLSSLFFPMTMPLMNPPSPSPSPSARVIAPKKPKGKAFRLYIQMQLCPHGTLEDWLNRTDRVVDPLMNMFLFHQIVSGLEHVHQEALIHRDLKPSNIFMGSRNEIRIGDFGLSKDSVMQLAATEGANNGATPTNGTLAAPATPSSPAVSEVGRETPLIPRRRRGPKGPHTRGVGSPLYCSPEQLKGKTYNEKTDIFSLGIIFVEMHCTFSTQMERLTLLGNARKGELPPDKFNPAARDFVRLLLDEDASNRPSAQDILAHPFVQLSRDHLPPHITPSHAAAAAAAVAAANANVNGNGAATAPVNQLHPFQFGAQDYF